MNLTAKEDEELSTLVDYFEEYESQSRENRKQCERDRDYADHKQWTSSQIQELNKRKQPPTINNRIKKSSTSYVD